MSLIFVATINAQTVKNSTIDVIMNGYSSKVFTTKPVTDGEIDLIIQCGMKAPSGMNQQPWRFTVIKTKALIDEIFPNTTQGNILIVISGQIKQDGSVEQYATGLATQNMYIAAQSLGLGSHIYAGPIANINTKFKETLGIPGDYQAVTILRVGNIDKSVDGVSAASTRKSIDEVVVYK